MLYPDLYETTLVPKNKLEEDLFAANPGSNSCVTAYVSKMFAVSTKDLPENKKKPITADEMRMRAREARVARQAAADAATTADDPANQPASTIIDHAPSAVTEEAGPKADPSDNKEVILGFARLYSGTIRTGTSVYAVLPKYSAAFPPNSPQNMKYLMRVPVEGLYVMMGRELIPVDFVRAGNTFAIKGLEGKVWRSATLCAPTELGIDKAEITEFCLVNLGGVDRAVGSTLYLRDLDTDLFMKAPPIVRVALEPAFPADMPKLVSGLKLLSQSDPCVEIFQQQTGEHVILTAGELHLEVCVCLIVHRFVVMVFV